MTIENASAQLGSSLRARRKALGLTQNQVCDLAGVGPNFLHQLENGKPTVRLDKLLAVLEVLGLGLQLGEGRELLETPALPPIADAG